MPDTQQQFDGQNTVPGYTLFHGKDGQNFYLKGENLGDDEIKTRVAKLRGQSASTQTPTPGPKAVPDDSPYARLTAAGLTSASKPLADQISDAMGRHIQNADQQALISGDPHKVAGTGTRMLKSAIDYGRSAFSPSGMATTAAAMAAPEVVGPALIAHGAYKAVSNAPAALEGNPDAIENSLTGAAEAVGGVSSFKTPIRAQRNADLGTMLRNPDQTLKPGIDALVHPTKIPAYLMDKAIPSRPVPAEYPGAFLPSTDDFYSQHGADIAGAVRQQPDAFSPPPPEPELGSPENPGFMSKLPARLPPSLRRDPFAPPVEESAEAGRQASVASEPNPNRVAIVPDERPELGSDRRGFAYSLKRTKGLPEAAQRGQPGAIDVLRQLQPTVVIPRSGGFETPNMQALRDSLGIAGNPDPFSPPAPELPQGNPSPFSPRPPSATEGWFRPTASRGNDSPASPVFVPADQAMALRRSKAAPDRW